jgi:hypothetical protein
VRYPLRADSFKHWCHIRVYHDECCYASHEGALSLWLPKNPSWIQKTARPDCNVLKFEPFPVVPLTITRKQTLRLIEKRYIVTIAGFICRCHGMMQVPAAEVHEFLRWSSEQMNRPNALENNFPMSSKIYTEDLCSFIGRNPIWKKQGRLLVQ